MTDLASPKPRWPSRWALAAKQSTQSKIGGFIPSTVLALKLAAALGRPVKALFQLKQNRNSKVRYVATVLCSPSAAISFNWIIFRKGSYCNWHP
nr:hypothetical protein [Novosphingopyxis baekryungensis]